MRDGSYCEPLGLDYAAMRAKTTKEMVIVAAWAIGEGAVYYAVFYWLIGMSIRLDISLAGICLLVSFTLAEVRHNRSLFDRADAELVQVSAIARPGEEKMSDFETKLEELGRELDDVKRNTVDSHYHFDEKMALYISKRISDCEDRITALEKRPSRQDTQRPT
jgi:septal ring factor EnvC (AmiA/AmiB activator)